MNRAHPPLPARHRRCAWSLAAGGLLMAVASAASGQGTIPACGEIGRTRGDYIGDRRNLAIVERGHFTPQVEMLIRGESGVRIGGDLDYTLKSFPNHHRALAALVLLGERENTSQPRGATHTIECYFDRALRFRPDDVVARMLYASYLTSKKRQPEAVAQLERTLLDAGDSPLTHHNIGLLFFDLKMYERALAQSHRATELGSVREDLRDKLRAAGQWRAPVAAPAVSPAASAASAAG